MEWNANGTTYGDREREREGDKWVRERRERETDILTNR